MTDRDLPPVGGAHTVAQVRAAEAALASGLPAGTLMQRAAAGLAAQVTARIPRCYGARVVVLAGAGDNGADALWAGARLAGRGARVTVLAPGRLDPPAREAAERAGARVAGAGGDLDRGVLAGADAVLDGLVGIGGRGPLRPDAARLAELTARARATAGGPLVVAVDVPSGVDADTGAVAGAAVTADVTVTFGTRKRGLLLQPGAARVGELVCVDIGLGPVLPPPDLEVLADVDVDARLPRPDADSGKFTRGVLGIVAGSDTYPGAAVLCSGGALRAGPGMVRFVSVAHPAELVRLSHPEVVVTVVAAGDGDAVLAAGRVQAWAVGPGVGTDDDSAAVLAAVLSADVPVVVDADALTLLAQRPELLASRRGTPTLLTPHAGEFARLTGVDADAVAADRLGVARRAASDLGVTVLLKGSSTVVADPDGRARVNVTGSGWLGTAGSGDVLTGACGALLACGLGPLDAGSVAAHLHGTAGEHARHPLAAGDLLAAWPATR